MNYKILFDFIYHDFKGSPDYKKILNNFPIIRIASKLKIALCGSTGVHLSRRNAKRIPHDIDFVTNDSDNATRLLMAILLILQKYRYWGRINIQNKSSRLLKGTKLHYKISTSLGTDICIMVLNDECNYHYWYNEAGICIQQIGDILEFANRAELIDNKNRPELSNG